MSSLVGELEAIVGTAGCLHQPEELLVYECDGLTLHSGKPSAVVLPRSREEVCAVVSACRAHGVPFVPRGAGTGLSGGAIANDGAVIVECSRMNRILEVNVEDRYAIVEPGVVNADLSKRTLEHGLFYAPDPSSQLVCTIGGNVAENSGGPHTLKYGTTTNHVLSIELVLPDASVVRLGSPSGFSPGYNLVGAIVGSEGTLGIVTQATVRLEPIPERVETLLVSFPDVVTACRAVGGIIGSGLTPAALEIIDRRTIAALEASVYAAGLPADAGAVLLVELDGAAVALPSQVERVEQISAREGATQVEVAADESERERFWRARKGAFGAMGRLAPDLYVHDAVVPRSKLPEVLDEICAIGDRYELTLSNVFHAGDGNLHPNISFDRRDPAVLERVVAAGAEILECCVRAGGVITGEHGVGNEKREFLQLVFSEADMEAMKGFRDCFNPDGVCNPGKIFPTTRFCVESNPKTRGYDRVEFD
ncbi:MAG: FAD-binding protein [Deltaproteobacteria bacterium]|jgi:glycolate oxidase subunit GlcD|nr:FAD-binding protein [Deltaproteobacteria bacterium]MBW2540505.1 FAD-binding protein [Deltaproteobacteria bacterium]